MRDLSLHLLDIAQNSIVANASEIKISYIEDTQEEKLTIIVGDNGKGMTPEQAQKVQDPFVTSRTTRDVGLGIPLFKMSAQLTGGDLSIESQPNVGTNLRAEFFLNSIDMLPIGDTAGTIMLLMTGNPNINFIFEYTLNDNKFSVSTKELTDILEDISISSPIIAPWLEDYINTGIESLK